MPPTQLHRVGFSKISQIVGANFFYSLDVLPVTNLTASKHWSVVGCTLFTRLPSFPLLTMPVGRMFCVSCRCTSVLCEKQVAVISRYSRLTQPNLHFSSSITSPLKKTSAICVPVFPLLDKYVAARFSSFLLLMTVRLFNICRDQLVLPSEKAKWV